MNLSVPLVDVVGVGLNATDTLIGLPHFPAHNSKLEFRSAEVLPGGQVASSLVACQLWGLKSRYIGKVGDDAAAELQRREFARAGVEAHLERVQDCPSQQAFILVDQPTGERTILWRRDSRLTIRPDELRQEWITSARILLVDAHDTAAAATAAGWAREAAIPTVADVDNIYPGLDSLLQVTDFLLASQTFPGRFTGDRDLPRALGAIARRFGCRVAGATLGHHGVLVCDASTPQTKMVSVPGFVVEVRDTTGAGDIFHAGFIFSWLRGDGIAGALEFACAAAALNCTQMGARGAIRPVAEIEALMRTGQRHPPFPGLEGFHAV